MNTIGRLVHIVSLGGVISGCATATSAPAMPAASTSVIADSIVVTVRAYYEIHAPLNADSKPAQEEMDFAVAKFTEQFGTPPYMAVMLFRSSQEMVKADLTEIHARKVPHLSWFIGGKEPPNLEGMRALSHEACHIMFNQRMRTRTGWTPRTTAPKPEEVRYGFEAMPDWMDEAAAVICEFPSLQQSRRELLRKSEPVALSTLFTMEHPSIFELRRMLKEAQPGSSGLAIGREPAVKPAVAPQLFYAQALSVAEFIIARGGAGAFARIADALGDGLTMDEALEQVPALPGTVAEFEAAWRASLK